MDCIKMEVDSENYVFVRLSVGSGFWIGISGPEVFLSIIQLLTAVFTPHPFEKNSSFSEILLHLQRPCPGSDFFLYGWIQISRRRPFLLVPKKLILSAHRGTAASTY